MLCRQFRLSEIILTLEKVQKQYYTTLEFRAHRRQANQEQAKQERLASLENRAGEIPMLCNFLFWTFCLLKFKNRPERY